jgi:GrpB-like predicted nucleotidyltransferase (UPF0157 family)
MVGLENGTVRLTPYTNVWKQLFDEEKSHLQAAVGKYVLDIQHVGSTSIPGMVAKPIIDIAIAVNNFEEACVCLMPVEQLGYEYKGEYGIPRRHFFIKGNPRTHHIHMNELGSRDWNDQLIFRNYLTQHQEYAKEYAELKMELARQYPADRQAYLERKAPFIGRVLQVARSEAKESDRVGRE